MNEEPACAVVIGLGAFGAQMARAIMESPSITLCGVGDRDPHKAARLGNELGVPHYTDNRQLLLNAKPRLACIATPPMVWEELLDICAKRGIHVWKEAPLGRHLGEAASLVRRFQQADLKLAVGTQRRFAESYRRARELTDRLGEIYLARGHYLFNWGGPLHWRADRHSAGGGALLELGYHLIDLILWTLGVPEEVYGLVTAEDPPDDADPPQPPHDTDDTATAVLRYRNDTMATLVTGRLSGPVSEEFAIHGRDGSITVNHDTCTLRSSEGEVLDHLRETVTPNDLFRRQAEAFAHAVVHEESRYHCSAAENLLANAVLEAMYLSAQTCQPESVWKQLQIHGLEVEECLQYSPDRSKS